MRRTRVHMEATRDCPVTMPSASVLSSAVQNLSPFSFVALCSRRLSTRMGERVVCLLLPLPAHKFSRVLSCEHCQ